MRVLAAAFEDPTAARRVLDELRMRYRLRPADVSMAPLGSGETSGRKVVVAGRFSDDIVPDIRDFVAEHGGQVVSEVDEQWTRSPSAHESLEPDVDVRRQPASGFRTH